MHVVVDVYEYIVSIVMVVQCAIYLGCYLVYTRELFEVVSHIKV